jgi:hypothetical protein
MAAVGAADVDGSAPLIYSLLDNGDNSLRINNSINCRIPIEILQLENAGLNCLSSVLG